MKSMNIGKLLSSSFQHITKNPIISIASLFLYALLAAFSNFSFSIRAYLETNYALTIWLVFSSAFFIAVGAFIFSGMIGVSVHQEIKESSSVRKFYISARKFWLKNFCIIAILISVSAIINFLSMQIARLFISTLGETASTLILFILLMAGLLGFLIFLSLASFVLVINNITIVQSIRSSVALVKLNYLAAVSIFVMFFAIMNTLSFLIRYDIINKVASELIQAIILFPWFVCTLSNLIAKNKIKS